MHACLRFPRAVGVAAALGVLLLGASGLAGAEEARTAEAKALAQLLDELPGQLAGVESITSRATLTTIANLELLGRADHTQKSRILFQRAGSSVRAEVGKLDPDGQVTEWQTAGPIPTPKSAVCTTTTALPDEKRRIRAATWTWSDVASDFRPFPEKDLRFDPKTATKIRHQAPDTAATAPK